MSDQDPHANTRAAQPSDIDKAAEFFKEWERLRGVATSELDDVKHGAFLQSFLRAYANADWQNAELLTSAMQAIEKKYKLVDRFLMLQGHKSLDHTMGEPGPT